MLNTITLQGRITHDLELKYTQSGIAILNFTLATERDFKNAAGEKEADFTRCIAWRVTAETIAKYFGKGRMILVQGSLQSEKWEDKDGNKRSGNKINVDRFWFCDSKPKEENSAGPAPEPAKESAPPPQTVPVDDSDLPF